MANDELYFGHCEQSPAPHGLRGEVKQSNSISYSRQIPSTSQLGLTSEDKLCIKKEDY
jgi:hypothetical protein